MDNLIVLLFGVLIAVRTQERQFQLFTGIALVLIALLGYGILRLR